MPDLANCSLAQQNFLKNQTRLRNRVRLARLLIFLGFLVLWEASTRMHLIDAFIFSSPTRVVRTFLSMGRDGSIFLHVGVYTLGGDRGDVLWKVVLPGSVPIFLNTMKVNIGLCLVGVIIGEFIGSRRGLGYLIIYGSQVFQLDLVLMSIVILCGLAMGLYQGLNVAEKRLARR